MTECIVKPAWSTGVSLERLSLWDCDGIVMGFIWGLYALDRLRHCSSLSSGGGAGEDRGLFAVAGDDPVAEDLVGGLDGVGINDEFLLAGVLGDELQAELEVL